MTSTAILSRYARSLVDVALQQQASEEVTRDLAVYGEIFETAPALLDAFDSPAIPRDAKQRVLHELVARYPVGQTTANFLRVLLEHNRIRQFKSICDLYIAALNERKGIVAARVTSAAPLSNKDQAALRDSLARVLGKMVTLEVTTDPDLLGGLVVRIGSTVYDGSIRKQLDAMRQRLMDSGGGI